MALPALGHVPWLLRSKEKRETGVLLLELKPPYVTQWLQPFLRLKALKKETHFESVSFSKCWLPFKFCRLLFTLQGHVWHFGHYLQLRIWGRASLLGTNSAAPELELPLSWILSRDSKRLRTAVTASFQKQCSQEMMVRHPPRASWFTSFWNLALETSLWSCVIPHSLSINPFFES